MCLVPVRVIVVALLISCATSRMSMTTTAVDITTSNREKAQESRCGAVIVSGFVIID